MVGEDGGMLLDVCREAGVDVSRVRTAGTRTGNAIIQVSAKGQNSIVLYPGANRAITREYADGVLADFGAGDLLLLQNEVNLVDYLIDRAHERGMTIALNPSPFDERMLACDLRKVDIFLLNEVEGAQISGREDPLEILPEMLSRFPGSRIVLTLGKSGVLYGEGETPALPRGVRRARCGHDGRGGHLHRLFPRGGAGRGDGGGGAAARVGGLLAGGIQKGRVLLDPDDRRGARREAPSVKIAPGV